MGFYDCRCMITGVSLKGMTIVAVVLQQRGDGYVPLTCGVGGGYDRYGSIDGIFENDNTVHILAYFQERLRAGEFVIDEPYFRAAGRYPLDDIERLLWGFERNLNDGPGAAMLRGEPLFCALMCGVVWEALGDAVLPAQLVMDWASGWFARSPVAEGIYGSHADELADAVGELAAVALFLDEQGIPWAPPEDPGQHYSDEMRAYLAEARRRFRAVPHILDALDAYEREAGDLLDEED